MRTTALWIMFMCLQPLSLPQLPAQTVVVGGRTHAGTDPSVGVSLQLGPGTYRVSWIRGCYNDCMGCPDEWRADVACTFAGSQAFLPTANGGTPPFPTPAACSAAYTGAFIDLAHTGGDARFWIFDSASANNSDDTIELSIVPCGTITPFGTGCLGSNGLIPAHSSSDNPQPGTIVTYDVANLPVGAAAAMWIGLSDTSWNGFPLPLNLGLIGTDPSCNLLTGQFASVAVAVTGTTGTASFWLPASFAGVYFTQVLVIDFGVPSPLTLTVSNGLRSVTTCR